MSLPGTLVWGCESCNFSLLQPTILRTFWSRAELFKSSSEELKDKNERQLFIDGGGGDWSLPLTPIYCETAAGSFFWILVVRNGWKRQLSIFMCSDSFKRARPRELIEGSTPIRFEYKRWHREREKKRIKSCTGRTGRFKLSENLLILISPSDFTLLTSLVVLFWFWRLGRSNAGRFLC